MKTFDLGELDSGHVYKLLVGSVLPRPIAFVSTIDADGASNLAPYSFFNVASVDPPILGFAPQRAPTPGSATGSVKDTLANIRATGECVVHIVSHAFSEAMNQTSGNWPSNVSEIEVCGFTPVASERVRPPRIAEARIAFECVLDQMISWGDHPRAGTLVLVRAVVAHVADELETEGRIDVAGLDPIGRLGGPGYVRVKDAVFEMTRPSDEDIRAGLL